MWFIKIHILLDCRAHTKKFTDVTSQCMLIINLKIYDMKLNNFMKIFAQFCWIVNIIIFYTLLRIDSIVTRKLYPEAGVFHIFQS